MEQPGGTAGGEPRAPVTSLPAVDVVVLTWNDGELLGRAVGSARASLGVDVNVVVVDNGSAPPAAVHEDERLVLVRNERNRGVAAGRNQGAARGSAPFLCFLDSDAELTPSTLMALIRPMLAQQDVGLAAPVFAGQRPEASAGVAPSLGRKLLRALNLTTTYRPTPRHGAVWDVDFAIGACQLIRREAFDAVGGLDETFFYGPEDVDFCLRLAEAGWRVIQVGEAACEHPARRRFRGLLTARGLNHAWAVLRHLWRHRSWDRRVAWSR